MQILDEHLISKDSESVDTSAFAVFRKLNKKEDLEDILEILKENDISYRARENKAMLDSVIIGQALNENFWIEIFDYEFKRANQILEAAASSNYSQEDISQHYLNELDDDELMEVLTKPDEWNQDATVMAKLILENRGKSVNERQIKQTIDDRLVEMKQPKSASLFARLGFIVLALVCGYFSHRILVMAGVGSMVCVLTGFYYATFKETAPDGERYLAFDSSTRQYGWILIGIAILAFLLALLLIPNPEM